MGARGPRRGAILSTREQGTLVLLAQGYTAIQIASLLSVTPNYIYSIMRLLRARFGAKTSAEILLRAVAEGVLSVEGRLLNLEGGAR